MFKKFVMFMLVGLVSASVLNAKGAPASTVQAAEKMMKSYEEVMKKGEMVKTLDFVYPKIFEISPKAQMKTMYEQSKESQPKLISYKYTIKKPIKQYKDGFYTVAIYSSVSSADMSKSMPKEMKKEFEDPKKVKEFQNMMTKMLGNGGAKVTFDNKNPFLVTLEQKNGKMLLINEKNSGWKLLDLSNKMGAMFASQILPDDILKDKSVF